MARKKTDLASTVALRFAAAFLALALFIFLPAGTTDYWQAWLYLAILFIPFLFVVSYLLKNDPALLQRRMHIKEKEATQKKIIGLSTIFFLIGFLVPGLDRRFGWSAVPVEAVLVSSVLVFLGYIWIFFVFRENTYASRVIEVVKGQKVITSGPYSLVRHPMYLGVLVMYLFTPLALGSYYALIFFVPVVPVLVFRILNEEEVLRRELAGYDKYCEKTHYRLVPYLW